MKNENGEIIYIGKAISLKNRVRQYFQSSKGHSPKVKFMVGKIHDFEYVITDSELEALILECNLIKKHRPRYNILLKDDKHYPYIKITLEDDFPRIVLTRRIAKDKNRYFGPYTSAKAVRETIEVIKKIFPVRTCKRKLQLPVKPERPCLYYHINQCLGPCRGDVDPQEYRAVIKQVCKFLDGKHDDLLHELRSRMQEAAEALMYEKAAQLRDQISAVERILEKQKVISTDLIDQDVMAFVQGDKDSIVQVFFIRSGKLMGTQSIILEDTKDAEIKEIIGSFVKQFYLMASFIPKEIILQENIEEIRIIERWLTQKRGNRVYIRIPQRGEKKKLLEMVKRNAMEAFENLKEKIAREAARTTGALSELAEYLNLEQPPNRIEAFDISNIQGTNTVASMVVFEQGKPNRSGYRRFRIRGVNGPNDFASMAEVVERRFLRGLKEIQGHVSDVRSGTGEGSNKFAVLPDLVLIDGGKGQLNAALGVMRKLGVSHIPAIGLAEALEEVYIENSKDPIIIPKTSNALHLLQRIRDEAHRFAISYHRSLRGKNSLHSILEDIPLIGPKRRKALFKRFGSVEAIREATLEELCKVEGMNRASAQMIQEYFKG